jgi:pyruvate dehydrogenase E2 component (dihydrolipoamide acetyltransferase)
MHASLHTMAQFTLHAMVDATALVEFRARLKVQAEDGTAPSLDAILARLTAQALREHPQLNARLVGQKIHLLQEIHIGIAVDTPAGLLVVVVRDADAKSLAEIDGELRSLVERARNGKARPDEVSGSTFTISNMGHLGIDAFTPIINPPEAALLGVGRIREELVVHEGKVAQRHRMTLSLTVDHRIVDGAPAARFLQHLAQLINEVG